MTEFSERLKQTRESVGWSKTKLAQHIGVSLSTYANWEYGIAEPDIETIKAICRALGVSYEHTAPDAWIKIIYNNYALRRITPHGLRHTLATLLNNEKNSTNIKDIQYLLGHKNASTTMDIYSHFTKENEEHVADSINKLDI